MTDPQLQRVTEKIGQAILEFMRYYPDEFHAEDLRRWVRRYCGETAPGSADRILRQLRAQKALNYVVVNRRQSLYRWTVVDRLGRDSGIPVAVSLANAVEQNLF